ncbi:MAG: hypothetical protein ACREAW_00230 [Nitrososphaera sp.]
MVEFDLPLLFELGSLIVETVIVLLLIKTVRDYAEVARMSRLQVKQRFRPWIGPTSGIEFLRETEGRHQYAVTVKNFGEIPATSVTASSTTRIALPTRDLVRRIGDGSVINDSNEKLDSFMLGPLLPNMEKRYWIFIDSDLIQKAKNGTTPLYTFVDFSYEFEGGKSGYGMISEYNPKTGSFVHKDMWVDQE